jgi:RNA polymerase sigma factor (TIGR02999 family)
MHSHVSGELGDITRRLHHWSIGNHDAENELFEVAFPTLQRLAQFFIKGERHGRTLEPEELVNQIYFRLAAAKNRTWQNRKHFFALAARAMRQHLIDRARARRNKEFISLEEIGESITAGFADLELLLSVSSLLNELAQKNPDWRKLVELKYSLGLNDRQTAEAMHIRLRTMQRMCSDARQWLFDRAGHRDNAVAPRPVRLKNQVLFQKGKTLPHSSY